jgi:hypothetical protein
MAAFMAGCNSGGRGGSPLPPEPETACSVLELEEALNEALMAADSEVDFSFAVERGDGRRFSFERGVSTLQTSYESASTSKLVSAVVILRLVEQDYLSLADRPQDYIAGWPIDSTDSLYSMTLSDLLSFTSGLTDEPLCINNPIANFENCVITIADNNAGNGKQPGQEFFYSGTHLQVAGLMAVEARGAADWEELFAEFKAQTGLFGGAIYDLPSSSNPRLAGGMHWTGVEYLDFLQALKNGLILDTESMNSLLMDHTADAVIGYSPTVAGLGEDWHYGFGLWHECASASFNCTPGARISSPGAYGAYPFWDRVQDYIGIVAREGTLGTFPEGVDIERSVRSTVEEWVECQ